MNLVTWFLKKNVHYFGSVSTKSPIVMESINSDRCPIGYRGVEVLVREDVLENGLTEEFLKGISNDSI